MKNKNNLSKFKNCISVMLIVSLLAGTLAGCAFPFGNDVDNVISREDVQADVDALLDRIYGTVAAEEDNDDDDLSKETVNVEDEVALGSILTTEGTTTAYDKDFTILEIVPNPEYAAFGYLIGGMEPIDCYAIDAATNREIGVNADVQFADGEGSLNTNKQAIFGVNCTSDNYENYYVKDVYSATGYMEKISYDSRWDKLGEYAVGGTYALKYKIDEDTGEKRLFENRAVFVSEYTDYDQYNYNDLFYKMNRIKNTTTVEKKDDSGNTVYDENGDPVTEEKFIYDYVPVDEDGNEVEYYDRIKDKEAYCWIWHDVEGQTDSTYNNFLDEYKDKDISEIPDGYCIYFNESDNFRKRRTYNNEMFLLHVLGVKGDSSLPRNGIFKDGGVLDDANINALSKYYGGLNTNVYKQHLDNNTLPELASKRITVYSLTPDEVREHHVAAADLIVLAAKEGGVYNKTRNMYLVEHDEKDAPDAQSIYTTDLEFNVMRAIYEKVITNNAAIAVSATAAQYDKGGGSVGNDFTKNVGRLMLMLFRFFKEGGDDFAGRGTCSDFFGSFYARRLAEACYALDVRDAGDGRVVGGVGDDTMPCNILGIIEEAGEHQGWLRTVAFDSSGNKGAIVDVEDWQHVFVNNFPLKNGGNNGSNSFCPQMFHTYYYQQGYRYLNDFYSGKTYKNQYIFTDDSSILMDMGNPWTPSNIQQIIQSNIKNREVGTIDFVGAGIDRSSADEDAAKQYKFYWNHDPRLVQTETYKESLLYYQFDIDEYVYYEDGEKNYQKVLYLTEEEFELAQKNGLKVYCLVYIQDGFDMITATSSITNESKTVSIEKNDRFNRYKIDETEKDKDGKQMQAVEFEFILSAEQMQKLSLPVSKKDGFFTATVESSTHGTNGKIPALGTDTLKIVVRDMFDLD